MTYNIRRWNGSVWKDAAVYRRTASAWVKANVYRWNGSSWVHINDTNPQP